MPGLSFSKLSEELNNHFDPVKRILKPPAVDKAQLDDERYNEKRSERNFDYSFESEDESNPYDVYVSENEEVGEYILEVKRG